MTKIFLLIALTTSCYIIKSQNKVDNTIHINQILIDGKISYQTSIEALKKVMGPPNEYSFYDDPSGFDYGEALHHFQYEGIRLSYLVANGKTYLENVSISNKNYPIEISKMEIHIGDYFTRLKKINREAYRVFQSEHKQMKKDVIYEYHLNIFKSKDWEYGNLVFRICNEIITEIGLSFPI